MHNLAVAEATEFSNNFYIRVKETSTGVNAFKDSCESQRRHFARAGTEHDVERQVQSYGEHDGQVVCAERAKLGVASAGESKGAILSRPKKNALGTFRRAAQKQLSLSGFV